MENKLKGILSNKDGKWVVTCNGEDEVGIDWVNEYPLHEDDLMSNMNRIYDYYMSREDYVFAMQFTNYEVTFKIIDGYAKLVINDEVKEYSETSEGLVNLPDTCSVTSDGTFFSDYNNFEDWDNVRNIYQEMTKEHGELTIDEKYIFTFLSRNYNITKK